MTAKKIFIAISAAVGLIRVWTLLRQKGFRIFPLYFLGFAIGLLIVAVSINRYQEGNLTRRGKDSSTTYWYQDVGMGIAFMLVAISGSWACISRGPETEGPAVFTPEDWEKFDAALSPDQSPPPPVLEANRGLNAAITSICVLHSFDTELVQRISEEFERNEIAYDRVAIADDSGLEAWELLVEKTEQTAAVALIEDIEIPYRIESSNVRCERCGSGMLVKEDEHEEPAPDVALFVCSNCKAEQLIT